MDILEISDIRRDGGTQMRAEIGAEKVSEYADLLEEGVVFPPVVVYHDGTDYWLADGFHRIAAQEQIKSATVQTIIHAGTRKDAIRHALRANNNHGKDRSFGDLQRCYQAAIENGFCAAHDAKAVKELTNCTKRWAEMLTKEARDQHKAEQQRKAQAMAADGKTQREIATNLGVPLQTVNRWLVPKTKSSFLGQNNEPAAAPADTPAPPPVTQPAEPGPNSPDPTTPSERSPLTQALYDKLDDKLDEYVHMKVESDQRKAHNAARFASSDELQAQSLYRTLSSWLRMMLQAIEHHEANGYAITPDERDREQIQHLLDQLHTFLERALP